MVPRSAWICYLSSVLLGFPRASVEDVDIRTLRLFVLIFGKLFTTS